MFSNLLTPAQAERLAFLIEEAAEVQHIACKILRHGYESYHPDHDSQVTNRLELKKEMVDLIVAMQLILDGDYDGVLDDDVVFDEVKKRKMQYMHHQGECNGQG